jgi:hypothetical protein
MIGHALVIDKLRPSDAEEMLRLARVNNQWRWQYTQGAHGAVVRDGDRIAGFCLLRETMHGFVVDELRCDRNRAGIASLGMLADWVENVVQRAATDRNAVLQLGGIVRLDNPVHKAALEKRGYTVVAEVLTKEFAP